MLLLQLRLVWLFYFPPQLQPRRKPHQPEIARTWPAIRRISDRVVPIRRTSSAPIMTRANDNSVLSSQASELRFAKRLKKACPARLVARSSRTPGTSQRARFTVGFVLRSALAGQGISKTQTPG